MSCFLACLLLLTEVSGAEANLWPGFVAQGFHQEQVREIRFAEDARAIVMAPAPDRVDPNQPILLIIYATPNGNTAEQTLGCQLTEGMDWHFDIQHVAAQWRQFATLEQDRTVVLACVQANALSWPSWKSQRIKGPQIIREIVEALAVSLPSKEVDIVLTGHSGGGSFLFGYLDSVEQVPQQVERIAFLDANYSFDADQQHGKKLIYWLESDPSHHLIVLAYDDREIEFNGKKVVGPTGGTFRATQKIVDDFKTQIPIDESVQGAFKKYVGLDGRFVSLVHPNPENKILHTRLVGEMNGLLAALTIGTPLRGAWSELAPTRTYTEWIESSPLQPAALHGVAPAVQSRRADAPEGTTVVESLIDASPSQREAALVKVILQGNIPEWWRDFQKISAEIQTESGDVHRIVYRVSPDYLAVGGNEDFVRLPLTPYTAQHLADMLGCVLPTRKMVDDIYNAATVKLAPQPLTANRETLSTFNHHNQLIQGQLDNRVSGPLLAGIKKDVVVSNELADRPGHVAIYGWHQLDGKPIQPLTTIHVDWYVDYSHGIRLVDQWAEVDGKPMLIEDVLRDETLCRLLSDEGTVLQAKYELPKME
ncbi:hemophore-related protein [Bythopirellula polymerisocia]|uniref:Alpha/beta hydrolase family protein n=1 Tax=Bythopirellula polymerisocia TaxID=2528003 RepID=A0A5C6CUF1_9BACT|nr:hemophore-related protein [Bythopirellula polymerisocia]TWU28048.1 hypothetical protein Pla144_13350 [Bythopirellula polymerisocia]